MEKETKIKRLMKFRDWFVGHRPSGVVISEESLKSLGISKNAVSGIFILVKTNEEREILTNSFYNK